MRRGTLFWVNLEPAEPPEFGKVRPGILISNSECNVRLSTVVIIPISTRPPEIWPLRVGLRMPRDKSAFAVLPGIRQVHKGRLREQIGVLSQSVLEEIDKALAAYLFE